MTLKKHLQNNKNISELRDIFLYLIVGAIATLIEWAVFYLLNAKLDCHYVIATIIAYIVSTFGNWAAGRILVFKKPEYSVVKEIVNIYIASIVGLLLNIIIMFVLIEFISLPDMSAKIVATILVFIYNYLVRKKVIYKQHNY